MTSTGINVGLNDDNRSSSRVLRPPGGGHTNIFGEDAQGDKPARKYHGRNESSILEGTNSQTPPAPSSPVKASAPPPVPQRNAEPAPQVQSTRGRVPPGGFSSGLW